MPKQPPPSSFMERFQNMPSNWKLVVLGSLLIPVGLCIAILLLLQPDFLGITPQPTAIVIVPTEISTNTPTPTLTHIPTATPIPSLQLNIASLSGESIAADGQSQLLVEVTIGEIAQGINLNGLTLFLQVLGAGSIEPSRFDLTNEPATYTAAYTAGETASESSVVIEAIVDVPNVGRQQASVALILSREELSIGLGCGYLVEASQIQRIPIQLTAPESIGGVYTLSASLEGRPLGQLGTGQLGNVPQVEFDVSTTQITELVFSPPTSTAAGTNTLCVEILDRPTEPPVCVPIVWGPNTPRLETRARTATRWADEFIPIVWGSVVRGNGAQQEILASYTLVSYDVLWTDQPSYTPLTLAQQPWQPNTCAVMPTGFENTGFLAPQPSQQTMVGRFMVQAPQIDGVATQYEIFMLGAHRIGLLSFAKTFFLPDDSTLVFQSFNDQQRLQMVSAQPLPAQIDVANPPPLGALIRLFVLDSFFEPETGNLVPVNGVLSFEVDMTGNTQNPDGVIRAVSDQIVPAYVMPQPLTRILNGEETFWREVYVYAQTTADELFMYRPE